MDEPTRAGETHREVVHNLRSQCELKRARSGSEHEGSPSSREDDQDVSGRPASKTVPIIAVVPGAVYLHTTIQGRRNRRSCSRQTVEFPSERLGASSNGVPQFGPRRAPCPLRPSLPRPCRRRRCASPEPRSREGSLYMRLRDELGAVFDDARGADRHLHGRSRLRLPGRSAEESRRRVDGVRPTAGARAGFAHPCAGRGIETGGNPNPTRFLLMIGEAAGARRQQVHLTSAPSGVLRSRPT